MGIWAFTQRDAETLCEPILVQQKQFQISISEAEDIYHNKDIKAIQIYLEIKNFRWYQYFYTYFYKQIYKHNQVF